MSSAALPIFMILLQLLSGRLHLLVSVSPSPSLQGFTEKRHIGRLRSAEAETDPGTHVANEPNKPNETRSLRLEESVQVLVRSGSWPHLRFDGSGSVGAAAHRT